MPGFSAISDWSSSSVKKPSYFSGSSLPMRTPSFHEGRRIGQAVALARLSQTDENC